MLLIQCDTKTNWHENFREKDKSPFGTYIIHNEVEEIIDDSELIYLKKNIYDYIKEDYEYDFLVNYVCVKSNANKLKDKVLGELLSFVSDGNNAFISLNYFNDDIKKALEFTTINLDSTSYNIADLKELNGDLYLENNELSNISHSYNFDRNIRRNYFESYNSETTVVLGTQMIENEKQPNFLKVYYGDGVIFLHTQPITFTNYFLLKNKESYTENVFSYMPNRNILWDPQVKYSNYTNNNEENKPSIFNFFWSNPSLKWALYVGFFGLILFMIFNARRKQRSIPIITSLKNSTVEFTHTIANLYLKEQDYKNAVDKKIKYFLEKVRTKYYVDTNNLNKPFIEKLAIKSGNRVDATRYLVNTIKSLNKKHECSEIELIRLNNLIEIFLNKNNNGRESK